MDKDRISCYLGNELKQSPLEWDSLTVECSYEQDNVQPSITEGEVTFTLDSATYLRNYVSSENIFIGLPVKIKVGDLVDLFDGFINMVDTYEDDTVSNKITTKIVNRKGLALVDEKLSSLTFGYLDSLGYFNNTMYQRVDYVIEKRDTALESLFTVFTGIVLTKETIESIKRVQELIKDNSILLTNPLSAPVTIVINVTVSLLIEAAYLAVMLVQLARLGKGVANTLISPNRKTKSISYGVALEQICKYLGYEFETNIEDMYDTYYLPSNTNIDNFNTKDLIWETLRGQEKGIPQSQDYGYLVKDFMDIVKKLFNPKYAIRGNKMFCYNEYDSFWKKNSQYVMPSVLPQVKRYNTEELKANMLFRFSTDSNDRYTIDNFKGTNYEVLTGTQESIPKEQNLIKGLEYIDIPLALANRKDKLNSLENALNELFALIDETINFLGGSSNLSGIITNKIGMMKVSNNDFSMPKVIRLKDGKIPTNHRDICSAKYFFNKYHYGKRFDTDFGQKIIYKDVRLPFNLQEFNKVLENNYFTNNKGELGRITSLKWVIGKSYCTVDYYIYQRYVNNLVIKEVEGE